MFLSDFHTMAHIDADAQLHQLFRACDTKGGGSIGREELRELCSNLGIGRLEADALFTDLDHDGDDTIDFNDFAAGFREFITPNGDVKNLEDDEEDKERKKKEAMEAWKDFLSQLKQSSNQVISQDRIKELEATLKTTSSSPQLISCFEQVFRGLLKDINRLQRDNDRLEKTYKREKESHENHLQQLEEEMDIQVQKLEDKIRQQAKEEAEAERRALKAQMEADMTELQSHLKLFQSFDNWLKKDKGDETKLRLLQAKLEEANQENRHLRMTLADTQTNVALLRSDLVQIRSQYEEKCKELHHEKELLLEYLHEQDHLTRQLHLLHEANKRLQDMNDTLRTSKEALPVGQRIKKTSFSKDDTNRSSIDGSIASINRKRPNSRSGTPTIQEGEIENYFETRSGGRPEDLTFGIKRFMEDLDSGLSTLRDVNEFEDGVSETEEEIGKIQCESQMDSLEIEEISGRFQEPGKEQRNTTNSVRPRLSNNIEPSSLDIPPEVIEPTGPPDRTYKVVFAGDAAVGKSSFILRISKGVFVPTISSTLGVDFYVKTLRVDEKTVTLQLWDTAGQERFRSVTKSYFRRADGVMLLYDCTNERSFLNVRSWMDALDDVVEKNLPIMLCSNKSDMREQAVLEGKTVVKKEDGEQLAREFAAIYIETSAKNGQNIMDAIVQLTRQMATNEDLEVKTSGLRVSQTEDAKKKSNCCRK